MHAGTERAVSVRERTQVQEVLRGSQGAAPRRERSDQPIGGGQGPFRSTFLGAAARRPGCPPRHCRKQKRSSCCRSLSAPISRRSHACFGAPSGRSGRKPSSASILAAQRRLPEAIALLDRVANDPEAAFAQTAREIAASLQPSHEAQARDLEYFLQQDHRWDQILDEQAQAFFALTYARTLMECGRFSEAVDWGRIAVELGREEPVHAVLISALVKNRQLEEAERELAAACKAWPRSEGLWSCRLQLDLVRGRWRAVVDQLDAKGFDRFTKHVGLKTAVITRAMAQGGVGDALGMLETCNAHPELSTCEELAELRADAEATRRAAERQKRRAHDLEAELSRVIDLRRMAMPVGPKSPEAGTDEVRSSVERNHAQLLARLTPASRAHLLSAGKLWEKLADEPAEDHGPVVLQLARALEGEVNRLLVDPFVGHALALGIQLSKLQVATDGGLRPTANRLSLGGGSGVAPRASGAAQRGRVDDGAAQCSVGSASRSADRELLGLPQRVEGCSQGLFEERVPTDHPERCARAESGWPRGRGDPARSVLAS